MPYQYSELNGNRRQFVHSAIEQIPSLTHNITRSQILDVCEDRGLTFPQWLVVPDNQTEIRGTYYFPHPGTALQSNKDFSVAVKEHENHMDMEDRIRETYDNMEELIMAVAANAVNGIIIAGAPGLGKSYEVNRILTELNDDDGGFIQHRGYLKATHLFRMLYENRFPGNVVVIDDCDSIFSDETALNILKAALELKPVRNIGWGSEKVFQDEEGEKIPRYFDFEGAVIFLTNLNVRNLINSGNKYGAHLAALESRSLILDMKIHSVEEYMTVIRMKLEQGLLSNKGISQDMEDEIMEFIEKYCHRLTELSLRMVEKIGALYVASPNKWKQLARAICLK